MFMFRSKRAVLTRRLLKAKVRGEHETECETQEDTLSRINVPSTNNITQSQNSKDRELQRTTRAQKSTSSSSSSSVNRGNSVATRFHQGCCGGDFSHDEDDELRIYNHHNNQHQQQQQQQRNASNRLTRCKELLKSLKENQLEMLLNVVESYGADFGSCVLVPRKQQQHQQQQQSSGQRRFSSLEVNSPPSSPVTTLKQQETMLQCNRHQRCGLLSTLHENPSRRLPHRHILRSRRHNPGTRCSRSVTCHSNTNDESYQQRAGNREDFSSSALINEEDLHPESRDNEMNHLRLVDTSKRGTFVIDDLRQEQPAWSGNREDSTRIDDTSMMTTGLGEISGETGASRPERDRCRSNHGKIGRSTTTGTRKRRDSPTSIGDNSSSSDTSIDSPPDDPHLLSCQIWRWPDLANSSELKKLPVCHSAKDPVYICCNPYHWSRLCKPESPPPPYCLIPDRLRPEDRAPSEISGDYHHCGIATSPQPHSGSLTTNGEGGSEMGQKEWCTLAYWELSGRVGRLYPVEPSTVNVFDSLHDGDGLCLAALAENHVSSPAVQRTRSKIGLGLMLSQESDGVWAYNRSDSPIFVNSPTLDDPESRTLLVYRVPPGFCLNIFDRSKTIKLPRCIGQSSSITGGVGGGGSFNSGPVDVNSVRISFAKGWGPKYSRQEVTSCPCWLEVLLAPCR